MVSKRTSKEASQREDKQLRDYEMVLILSPEIADESLDTTIDTVSRFITEKGGIISNTEHWGKKRFAYPIKHFLEGNYVLTQCKIRPAFCKELEARLQVSEEVLRHLLVKLSS